jgi:hypothetical protein
MTTRSAPIPSQIVRWPGASGRWYAHTVFPWDALPEIEGANFILVATDRRGTGEPLYIGRAESLARELVTLPEWCAAQTLGLTQVHVHLLAVDGAEREAIRADLAACVPTPLNLDPRDAGQAARTEGGLRMAPGGAALLGANGAELLGPNGPVRWLGGRQASPRALQLGLEFILPQAASVRRAG